MSRAHSSAVPLDSLRHRAAVECGAVSDTVRGRPVTRRARQGVHPAPDGIGGSTTRKAGHALHLLTGWKGSTSYAALLAIM